MKSIEELSKMLNWKLKENLANINLYNPLVNNYNQLLVGVSTTIGLLLESLLKRNGVEWINKKWIDDCLLLNVVIINNVLKIEGVVIWGKSGTTEEWVDPFVFEAVLEKREFGYMDMKFYFKDTFKSELIYENYRDNQNYWKIEEVHWKYILDL